MRTLILFFFAVGLAIAGYLLQQVSINWLPLNSFNHQFGGLILLTLAGGLSILLVRENNLTLWRAACGTLCTATMVGLSFSTSLTWANVFAFASLVSLIYFHTERVIVIPDDGYNMPPLKTQPPAHWAGK